MNKYKVLDVKFKLNIQGAQWDKIMPVMHSILILGYYLPD